MTNIKITKSFVRFFLYISRFFNDNTFLVVCKGYDEDDENYTGLYWRDDKDIYLKDDTYFDFQIWYWIGKK